MRHSFYKYRIKDCQKTTKINICTHIEEVSGVRTAFVLEEPHLHKNSKKNDLKEAWGVKDVVYLALPGYENSYINYWVIG